LLRRSHQKIINGDDPYLREVGQKEWQDVYWTSITGKEQLLCNREKGVYIEDSWVVAFGELILHHIVKLTLCTIVMDVTVLNKA